MTLNKNQKSTIACYLIALIAYSVLFWIIPFHKGASEVISFAFTVFAFVFSFAVCCIAFKKGDVKSALYGFPIFRVGIIYLIAQLICGVVFCIIGSFVTVPYWISIIVFVILLAIASIGVIATDSVRDEIENIEKQEVLNIQQFVDFQINISALLDESEDDELKDELKRLSDAFMYSDPVSAPSTKEIEASIKTEITKLSVLLKDGSNNDVLSQIKNIQHLLNTRNSICQKTKQNIRV